ncbi:putative F-box associated domain, type 1 [Arabidopsis thaliana]|uniref:EMB2743 n=1 Tax=Arabidopsis thaliana TaxID=3702 RepID=A0A178V6A3_ARATH|nr:EMB2743 [Arabidopsis thaliana]
MEIWITSTIEPNAVSWNSKVFLSVSIRKLIGPPFQFCLGSFFIDEEKKVAVVFDKDYKDKRNIAYIIGDFGVDGSFKEGISENQPTQCVTHLCALMFQLPSLVQFN